MPKAKGLGKGLGALHGGRRLADPGGRLHIPAHLTGGAGPESAAEAV